MTMIISSLRLRISLQWFDDRDACETLISKIRHKIRVLVTCGSADSRTGRLADRRTGFSIMIYYCESTTTISNIKDFSIWNSILRKLNRCLLASWSTLQVHLLCWFGGDPIEIVKETKLLGVLITDDQKWKSRINSREPFVFSKEIPLQTMFHLKFIYVRACGQF